MTPKMLHEMKAGLSVETAGDLLAAIETGSAETLSGVGERTLILWRRILELPPQRGAVPAHEAWLTALTLAVHIGSHLGIEVEVSGAVRRVDEWVDHIDLLAVGDDHGELAEFVATTASLAGVVTVEDGAIRTRSHSGTSVIVHPAMPANAGTALVRTTGPPDHAREITDRSFGTETEAYASIGLPVIPPPARGLDLVAARAVVTQEDLKGDLHLHTDRSPDGHMTLETILEIAATRGYSYLLITDHTEGLRFGGMGSQQVAEQAEEMEGLRGRFPSVTVFHGAELNIGADGRLDLPEEALALLDFAVAGVHSHFSLDRDTQTERVLAALAHPAVRVLAHPFGRRIGIRPALDLDMDEVIASAVEQGVAPRDQRPPGPSRPAGRLDCRSCR
jgi:DNA polymerase (family 10)